MPYISTTEQERKELLKEIGVDSFNQLIADIPEKFVLNNELKLERPYSEQQISKEVFRLTSLNKCTNAASSFLGAGVYDHFIPAAVDTIVSRPEFYTAYTPYQAEVSQGTLQFIYEFQTMICELTGMEVANSSMYDGASAVAEAILMSVRKTKKTKAIIAGTIHPNFKNVIKRYTEGIDIELVFVTPENGVVNLKELEALVDDNCACVVVQNPNFLGNMEDLFAIEKITHATKKALLIVATDPIALAITNSPAEYNADIVVGEGQALGNNTFYGGPLFGFFATKLSMVRTMPGRIVGATLDAVGNKAYSLTLQAREQHIRRSKATSNICSNQSLCTLAATVYMSLMGKEGLKEVATQSITKAHYLAQRIAKLDGFSLAYPDQHFFKEFVINTPIPAIEVLDKCLNNNIYAGVDMKLFGYEKQLMIAVTEKKTKAELDEFIKALAEVK
ncbi:MAG: glycine dehydrogenase (aminomethyl-transferring) [Candidatus Cloacimonetes bacterium 4572_65]|nr:MAG: glycine dehydrogenase (aminomethyl-transferring) [Candidatus Cloacimonetes bacterium 4572_65]